MSTEAQRNLSLFFEGEIAASGASSLRAYADQVDIPEYDVRRCIKGKNAVGIDTLQRLANKLGVQPWHLLYPGFRRNAKEFPVQSTEAIDLGMSLDRIRDDAKRRRVYAQITRMLDEIVGVAQPDEPEAQPAPSADTTAKP